MSGVHTRLSKTTSDDTPTSLRRQIIQQLHAALKQAQDDVAVGTGSERRERWMAPAPGGHGNLPKGAPGSESRTGPRLVSPAAGGEKIKWNLLYFGLRTCILLDSGHLLVYLWSI